MAATGGLCRELGGESAGEFSLGLKEMITPFADMGERRGRVGGISSKSRKILALGQNPHQLVSGQWVGSVVSGWGQWSVVSGWGQWSVVSGWGEWSVVRGWPQII